MKSGTDKAKSKVAESFRRFEKGLNGHASGYVHSIRRQAMCDYMANMDTFKNGESWKYIKPKVLKSLPTVTDVYTFEKYGLPSSVRQAVANAPEVPGNHLVLVNGVYSFELSTVKDLPKGAVMGSLAQGFSTHPKCMERNLPVDTSCRDSFSMMSSMALMDGIFIFLPQDTVVDKPVTLSLVISDYEEVLQIFSRIMVVCEAHSKAQIFLRFITLKGEVFAHTLTQVYMARGSMCEISTLLEGPKETISIASIDAKLQADSCLVTNNLNLDAKLTRSEVRVNLSQAGASSKHCHLSMAKGEAQVDDVIEVSHNSPQCHSEQSYKGVFNGSSLGSFYGKVVVDKDAVQTNAKQKSQGLLLSKEAVCNARPQLEIDTDDVACSHGSTVGQLDDDALFYLKARGIEKKSAEDMLTLAFTKGAFENITSKEVRNCFESSVKSWLSMEGVESEFTS